MTAEDDLARRMLTVASCLVTLAVNGAANAVPINGQQTAEISDRYEVYVVPAGYVFGTWGRDLTSASGRSPCIRRFEATTPSCAGSAGCRRSPGC